MSLNRFEGKKNIKLAIDSFVWLKKHISQDTFEGIRLVIAGGYDRRLEENRSYLKELEELCWKNGLEYLTLFHNDSRSGVDLDVPVLFLASISEDQRNYLLRNSLCLLYTPVDEHFGIVPIEAMSCGIPVIAANTGGPCETIINGETGFLCDPTSRSFGTAIQRLLLGDYDLQKLHVAAKRHVNSKFRLEKFGQNLERILLDVLN